MAGVYLHIPFCKQACHYCDFHFSTNQNIKAELLKSMKLEISERSKYLDGEAIETIYFGGGTPSVLTAVEIAELLGLIKLSYTVKGNPEITLEANPDDLSGDKLHQLVDAGINRLSIGIQSFSNDLLKFLNRGHDSSQAVESVHLARLAGFNNINIDLIYAIPGQSMEALSSDLSALLELHPEHVSCYGLTVEEKTVFGKWSRSGKFNEVSDEINADHFRLVMSTLTQGGYDHYEISNFSLPGLESQHNSAYWKNRKYIGIGPSAHSYDGVSRRSNVANNHQYVRAIRDKSSYYEVETLTREDKVNEYLLTSLRTKWGSDLSILRTDFQYDLQEKNRDYLHQLTGQGLITLNNGLLKLTNKGKFVADEILAELVVVNSKEA